MTHRRSLAGAARRFAGRLGLGLGAVLALLAVVVSGLWWTTVRQLLSESLVIETRLGPIEYAAFGEGPDVLVIHGSPGGYDQLVPLARVLAARGYRATSVSRPGYLRTPLSVGSTPEQQADAFAVLLDSLAIRSVVVIGVSGGGPATLQFALRHPDRVRGVVMICAVSRRFREGDPNPDEVRPFDLRWDIRALAAQSFPSFGLRRLGVAEATERRRHLSNPATVEAVRYLFQSLGFSSRRRGYLNDALTTQWNDLDYPLERVRAPTLVLHGSDDANVPLTHGEKVASAIPGARLRVLDGAGHAIFVLHHEWVEDQLVSFLAETHD